MSIDFPELPEQLAEVVKILGTKIDFQNINNKGGNGYVLIGRNRLIERQVVVKFYYWGGGVHAEPKLLSDLASPHVLKVEDAASVDEDWAYFVTPFCEGGDLDDVIQAGGIGVKRAVDILLDIAIGANFIHSKGFFHRDLKPSNILCNSNGRFLIGDFGSVVKAGADGYTETSSRHSLIYRTSEEITLGRASARGDVYQLGIVFYQLLGGSLPYDEEAWLKSDELVEYMRLSYPNNQIYAGNIIQKKIIDGTVLNYKSLPVWCPPELVLIIRKCCTTNPLKRFESVSALITALNNLRNRLPDWRPETHPVLHRHDKKLRVIADRGQYFIEKMTKSGTSWRKVHTLNPSSMQEAIKAAQQL